MSYQPLWWYQFLIIAYLFTLQSVEKIQWKLSEELISEYMHYQPLFTMYSRRKHG